MSQPERLQQIMRDIDACNDRINKILDAQDKRSLELVEASKKLTFAANDIFSEINKTNNQNEETTKQD